jgi:hypothetical protein
MTTAVGRLRELNSALVYLLGVHLRLDRSWDHRRRWLDEIQWNSLSFGGTTVQGNGKFWWGPRMHISEALVVVEFKAMLELRSTGQRVDACYIVTFESDGVSFRFCSHYPARGTSFYSCSWLAGRQA